MNADPTLSPPHELEADHAASSEIRSLPTLAIIGLGYVGLPLYILAKNRGYDVVGFDIDEKKLERIREREVSLLDEHEQAQLAAFDEVTVGSDESILDGIDAFIICVPTPVHEDHEPDLGPLVGACEIVGRHLSRGALVAIESTVSPGVCDTTAVPILERKSGLTVETDFLVAHCPERINPGDPNWNVRTIPRVLGANSPRSFLRSYALYRALIDGPLYPLASIKEAEAVKMVENAFRDVNIAFVNELAMSFDKAGIDIVNVLNGAATKPFGFMPHFPGAGVGGHCIPVDPYYLIRYGRENGFEHDFLVTARRINNGMPAYVVDLVEKAFTDMKEKLSGKSIALLGLAYKKNVSDMRESPALVIRDLLVQAGANVRTYDPYVLSESDAQDLNEVLTGADAVVVATEHTEFAQLTPHYLMTYGINIVIDGRNCLPKEPFIRAGFTYHGIGRS